MNLFGRSLFRLGGPQHSPSIHVTVGATPLTVLVQSPSGGAINDVEVEVHNLRKEPTGSSSNQVTFKILGDEYNKRVKTEGNKVTIKVRKAHFGPPSETSTQVTPGESAAMFDFPMGTPSSFVMRLQDAALNRYDDLSDTIPARALTLRQARDALLCLHRQGRIRLIPEPIFNHRSGPDCDAGCKLAHPLVGERVGISSQVHGVDYLHIDNAIMPQSKAAITTSAQPLLLLDVRNAVALWRLARLLHSNYSATGIFHIGISGADPSSRNDCHGQGRAVDFGGVIGADPTSGDYKMLVFHDWGVMQVLDLNDPEPDLALKRRLPQGQNWPPGDRTLMYRLNPLPPGGSDLARRMFQDVYNFAVAQYNDKTATATQTEDASVIGGGGRVMNPDHHDSNPGGSSGREAHINHIHMQIGSTGSVPAPSIEPEP